MGTIERMLPAFVACHSVVWPTREYITDERETRLDVEELQRQGKVTLEARSDRKRQIGRG